MPCSILIYVFHRTLFYHSHHKPKHCQLYVITENSNEVLVDVSCDFVVMFVAAGYTTSKPYMSTIELGPGLYLYF